jgi:hypothetical protein
MKKMMSTFSLGRFYGRIAIISGIFFIESVPYLHFTPLESPAIHSGNDINETSFRARGNSS